MKAPLHHIQVSLFRHHRLERLKHFKKQESARATPDPSAPALREPKGHGRASEWKLDPESGNELALANLAEVLAEGEEL